MNKRIQRLLLKNMGFKPINKALSVAILRKLQHKTGLYSASKLNVTTGYNKAWIRDNIYEALGIESVNDYESVKKTYRALLDVLRKHEYKINWAINNKPDAGYKYIHARYHPITFDEFHEEWGNKQNDAVGLFLFKIGDLEKKGISILRDTKDFIIIQKLVNYLASIEYWRDPDNGIWEETEELHSSSIGACVAGLKAVKDLVIVPSWLIRAGEKALDKLLPNESPKKKVDLALLSLIYPYNVVNSRQKKEILKNIEKYLVKARGVIRYIGDKYYNRNGEPEWTMGFPWLAKIYKDFGNEEKHKYYMEKTHEVMNNRGELPELYFANSEEHNENSPLGWSQAMYLVAVA